MSTLPIKYSGEYEWNITDPSFVSKFLAAPPGARFSSDTFIIGGLEWKIHAYPKGKFEAPKQRKDHIEGCELYLQLLSKSWPHKMKKIIFNYRLYCPAANSSFTNIHSWNKSDKKYFVHWFRGTLTTKELEACEGRQINFKFYINILRIINFAHNPKSRYHNRSKQVQSSPVKYQFPFKLSSIDPSNPNKNVFEYEYKVDNIEELFVNTKCGKHLESPIFDNLWCLRIAPKGWKLNAQNYVCLWLQLCGLPINISKLKVRFTVKCVETNTIHFSKDRYFRYYFHDQYAGWNQKKLLTKSLKRLKSDTLTFQGRITILAKYDLNGHEIPMIKSSNNWIRSDKFESAGIANKSNDTHYAPKKNQNSTKNHDDQPSNMFESANTFKSKRASKWVRSKATEEKAEEIAIAAPAVGTSVPDEIAVASPEYIAGPGNMDAEDEKSSEIDGLRQQIVRLNSKVATMQQTIDYLQSKLGIMGNEESKENTLDGEQSIVEILRQTQDEIIALKKFTGLSGFVVNATESSANPVKQWLTNVVGLPQYYKNFEENGFDAINSVKRLIIEQLEILGIEKLGHKLQIMCAIEDLKNGDNNNEIVVSEGAHPTGNTKYI